MGLSMHTSIDFFVIRIKALISGEDGVKLPAVEGKKEPCLKGLTGDSCESQPLVELFFSVTGNNVSFTWVELRQ